MSAVALGGGELVGHRPVRFVYLDESGTGDPKVEPWVIVAGVMVKDDQWKAVENYLTKLADNFALPEDRLGFTFHAQELFTGGKKAFHENYPLEKRHAALKALCEVAERFSLSVFMHYCHRAWLAERRPGLTPGELLTEALMHTYICCANGIERFMRQHDDPSEVAVLVYENNSDKNRHIRDYHQFFRSDLIQPLLDKLGQDNRLMKFGKIIESPLFSPKTASSLLQLADVCSYILNRRLRGVGIHNRFYAPIRRQLKYPPIPFASDVPL